MTTEQSNPETPSSDAPVVEKDGSKVTIDFKKLGKRALIWGGAAVGIIAGVALLRNTSIIAEAIEDDSVTILRPSDNVLVIEEHVPDAEPIEVPENQQ